MRPLPPLSLPLQVLLLGRLSAGLASDSKFLPVLLGPPEHWRAAAAAAAGGSGAGPARALRPGAAAAAAAARSGAVGTPVASQKLQSVTDAIHATALSAYRCVGGGEGGIFVVFV